MPFFPVDDLRAAASGRWSDILTSAGIPEGILDGRSHPCPKCGGRDRFAVFADFHQRGAVHCRHCFTRGSQIAPNDGISTLRWWLGLSFADALSSLADSLGWRPVSGTTGASSPIPSARTAIRSTTSAPTPIPRQSPLTDSLVEEHTRFARAAFRRMTSTLRNRIARSLSVSVASLYELRVGITSSGRCTSWPMRDPHGRVIGVRLATIPWETEAPGKWSRRSSQSGLFASQPDGFERSRKIDHLFVTEGASDTAAAITAGAWAIGRDCCTAPPGHLIDYVNRQRPKHITVISDGDLPGRRGAITVARALIHASPRPCSIRVIIPPSGLSDLREWVRRGAGIDEWIASPSLELDPSTRQGLFDFANA